MNSETKLNVLTSFPEHRLYILNSLNSINSKDEYTISKVYMAQLKQKPVSKLSLFSDNIWDFNSDYPHAARNIKGSKLRINFQKYSNVPAYALLETKIIFELALLNNLIFKPQQNGGKSRTKGILKANTLISIFESGLTFINEVFTQANNEFGYEFVQEKFKTLCDITPDLYKKAAENYRRVKSKDLEIFFKYLRNPASLKYVFEKPLPYVELNSLEWKILENTNREKKEQVLPDLIFEHLSKVTSFIIIDFLNAIGDREKISDTKCLERFNTSHYSSWANQQQVTRETLYAYIAIRLKTKGYSSNFILNLIEPHEWMMNESLNLSHERTLRSKLIQRGYRIDSLREYFNLVAYSCTYLVGQYTGMRPSELSEVQVQDCSCLVEENEIWLIESTVKKHRNETNTGLFDDRWVAIPIVKDAILAASYISKIQASPYLASSVDTCPPKNLPIPLNSNGIKHQINLLILRLLGESAADQIQFNAYMLRHTLTYQLFRAEVGLPLISFQLKHFVESISKYTSYGATSSATMGYGDIGEMLSKDGGRRSNIKPFRRKAELEAIKTAHNPNGIYYGGKAKEHQNNLIKTFQGYIAAGYSEEDVYEAMADQGVAVVYMGQGLCYGGREEESDSSLPCIGSLRCNPARCKHAIVTNKHAPKWREVYILNKANLNKPEYAHNYEHIMATMNEAKMVLEYLGEKVEL